MPPHGVAMLSSESMCLVESLLGLLGYQFILFPLDESMTLDREHLQKLGPTDGNRK